MHKIGHWIRQLAWPAAVVALLAGLVWWGLPALLMAQLPPRLSEALGRPVTIQALELEPLRLDLTLHGLRIGAAGEAPGAAASAPALLQIGRLHVDVSIASLRRRAPVIEALDVDGLRLNFARTAPGHYDIDDLIQRFSARPASQLNAEPTRFSLNNLALRDAQIRFDDRPVGQVHELTALTLTLPFLSDLPDEIEIKTEPRLVFDYHGTRFDTGSQALPFAETRSGTLSLAFEDFDLQPALGYLPAGLPLTLSSGRLSSDLRLKFSVPVKGQPSLVVKGQLALRDVALAQADGAALASWKSLALQLTDVRPLQRHVGLGALKLDGADLRLARDAKGQINLLGLLPPRAAAGRETGVVRPAADASAAASGAGSAPPPKDWTVELASLRLTDARLRWTDDAVRPQAALQVDGLGVEIDGLRWPAPAPLPVSAHGTLRTQRAGAPAAGSFDIDGQVHPEEVALTASLDALDLSMLGPYLADTLRPQVSGRLAAKAQVDWAASPAALTVKVDSANLQDLQLHDGAAPRAARLASARRLAVTGLEVDLPARRLVVGRVLVAQPALAVTRDGDGQLSLEQWLAGAKADAGSRRVAAGTRPTGPPWRVLLRDLSVTGGQMQWRDALAADADSGAPVQLDIDGLSLRLQDLVWPAPAGAKAAHPRLRLAARIGAPVSADSPASRGEIDWDGRIGLAPLQAQGRLLVKNFPLQLFVPYARNSAPVRLLNADAGFQGQVRVRSAPAGWQIGTEGDAQVLDLRVQSRPVAGAAVDSGGAGDLLRWQSLALQGLSFAMAPPERPQLVVRKVTLNDFDSRLQITPDGRLNLQDVAGRPSAAASAAAAGSAPVAAAQPAASAASAEERLAVSAGRVIDLDIGGIALHNGAIDFSDYFIRPNYSARLTELEGAIGRLRSGTREMASISLRGRAAGTALLAIDGQFNPTVDPLALDIHARATDLELAPLSPYAAKYAGYGIERGKLSMDVTYKIDADGKLDAKNQVILNQLTFGEKVESPSATQLPVLLAVALLTDRNGVIDVNLPVSGSVNDPKFSVGGIIWQVIVNLLTKAVTAPFSLLAGGGGTDLSVVPFEPGSARLTDGGRQALGKVAKSLEDRPALIMTVTGAVDPVAEQDAARREALQGQLLVERRREKLRQGNAVPPAQAASAASAAAEPPLSAEERAQLLKRLYQQTPLPDKPRNALGMLRDLAPAEMEARLLAGIAADEVMMRELALQRGLAVRDGLIGRGLASERLFLAAPRLHQSGAGGAAWVPQASLSLSAR